MPFNIVCGTCVFCKHILRSVEHPNITAVSEPLLLLLAGLSGKLRRVAFKYSNLAMDDGYPDVADRINVVEGITDDLKHRSIPNILPKKTGKQSGNYNREKNCKKLK